MCCCRCGSSLCMFYAFAIVYTVLATGTLTAGVVFENIGEIVGGSVATVLEAFYIVFKCCCCGTPVDMSDDIIEC